MSIVQYSQIFTYNILDYKKTTIVTRHVYLAQNIIQMLLRMGRPRWVLTAFLRSQLEFETGRGENEIGEGKLSLIHI